MTFPLTARFPSIDRPLRPRCLEEAHGSYLVPKELTPLGTHRLNGIWEDTLGAVMDSYLLEKQAQRSILNPLRISMVGKPPLPAFILVGVNLALSLSNLALRLLYIAILPFSRATPTAFCELKFTRYTTMYKPAVTFNHAAIVRGPITALGVPICNAETPGFGGTGGFSFVDISKPGILYPHTTKCALTRKRTSSTSTVNTRVRPVGRSCSWAVAGC